MKRISFLLLILTFVTDISAQTTPPFLRKTNQKWVDSVFNKLTPDERIAQLIMVAATSDTKKSLIDTTFSRPAVVREYIDKYKIGGVIFFQGSPYKQAILTNEYQKRSKTPLLIAIDGEWGLNMRLDSTVRLPYQMTLGAIQGDFDGIYDMGREMAKHCKRLGVHINFAPTVDINNNPSNPVINFRSFGENKQEVFEKAYHYMRGMQDGGILSSIKHFPGHGDTGTDSHYNLPVIKHDRQHLNDFELYPFKKLIEAGADGVMVAHLSIPILDDTPNQPSTLSKKIVTDLLKKELGFKGMIYSDAMNMQGLTKFYKDGQGEVNALVAGLEILEFVPDIPKAIEAIKKAISEGKIKQSEIDERCKKVLASKTWAGLDNYKPIDLQNLTKELNPISSEVVNHKLYQKAVTLLRDDLNQIPIKNLGLKIATVSIDVDGRSAFQKMLDNYTNLDHFTLPKNASNQQVIDILSKTQNHDLLLIAMHQSTIRPGGKFGLNEANIAAVEQFVNHKNAVLTVFGNPYSLDKLKGIDKAKGIVMAYQLVDAMEEVAAQAIVGALPFEGRLPSSINATYKVGQGVDRPSLHRLQYGFPELVGVDSKALATKIDSVVNIGLKEKAMPGAVVQIAKDGMVIFKKAYGKHTYDASANTVNTTDLYDLASITKITTSALGLMQMVDQKKINLDATLSEIDHRFVGSNKQNMVLREMLTHKAGLKAWIPFWTNCIDSLKSVEASEVFKSKYFPTIKPTFFEKLFSPKKYKNRLTALIKTDKNLWNDCVKPGQIVWKSNTIQVDSTADFNVRISDKLFLHKNYKDVIFEAIKNSPVSNKKEFVYSDLGFYLYPQIISQLTNQNWEEFLKKTYQKIGANSLTYNPLQFYSKNQIVPTEFDEYFRQYLIHGRVHDEGAGMLNGISGHAGLFGNANDLMKLMNVYYQKGDVGGEQIISKTTVSEFTSYQFDSIYRGLAFEKPNPKRTNTAPSSSEASYGHSGFTGTYTWVDTKENLLFVFLSNRVTPTRNNRKIIDLNIRTQTLEQVYQIIQNK